MLAQAAALLLLVAEQLRDGEPLDRLLVVAMMRPDHAGQRGRHLGPQRHRAVALVHEVEKLTDDFIAGFLRVKFERFQRRAVVLAKPIAPRHVAPLIKDIAANGECFGIKVAKAG